MVHASVNTTSFICGFIHNILASKGDACAFVYKNLKRPDTIFRMPPPGKGIADRGLISETRFVVVGRVTLHDIDTGTMSRHLLPPPRRNETTA